MTTRVARSGRSGPVSLSQERHGFPRTEDCLSVTYLQDELLEQLAARQRKGGWL